MSYVIRISYQDRIWNIDMSDRTAASVGSSEKDTVQILVNGIEKSQVSFSKDESGSYFISGNSLFRIINDKGSPVFYEKIDLWNMYRIEASDEIYIAIHPRQSDWNRMLPIKDKEFITIGRTRGNLIILRNGRTSGRHCEIYQRESEFYIKDMSSTNGTYVNGFRIVEEKLHDGDWITISIYQMLIQGGYLYLFNTGGDVSTELKTESISLIPAEKKPEPEKAFGPTKEINEPVQPEVQGEVTGESDRETPLKETESVDEEKTD